MQKQYTDSQSKSLENKNNSMKTKIDQIDHIHLNSCAKHQLRDKYQRFDLHLKCHKFHKKVNIKNVELYFRVNYKNTKNINKPTIFFVCSSVNEHCKICLIQKLEWNSTTINNHSKNQKCVPSETNATFQHATLRSSTQHF